MGNFKVESGYSHTIESLVVFAGSRMEPYVNYVAYMIFHNFPLSVSGQQNISRALNNLPALRALDESLSFGWSSENIIRLPALHQHGYEHVGIMAALSSCFHETFAAEVLHHVASAFAAPDDLLPHPDQWKTQLLPLSGILESTDFSLFVEDFVRLDPFSIGPGTVARKFPTDPQAVAKALLGLSQVLCQKRPQLILKGGAAIAWFAAISQWLYDLRIAVFSITGKQLFGDALSSSTQCILIFDVDADMKVLAEWTPDPDVQQQIDMDHAHTHFLPFGGRVVWQSLLPRVFGHAFPSLDHAEGNSLATAIGAAARGLEGGVKLEAGDHISEENKANPASYGIGLIQTITGWLPELRRGQGRMERQLKLPYMEAGDLYHSTMSRLQQICNCMVCSVSDSQTSPKHGYCLAVLIDTIVSLGLAVSRLMVSSGLCPTREGVQHLYNEQAARRMQVKHLDKRTHEYFDIIFGNEWNASESRRLQNAIALFSGTRAEKVLPDSLVAISHEGVCAYMLRLGRPDSAPPKEGTQGMIRVVNGGINVRQKIYTRVSTELPVGSRYWEMRQFEHWSKPLYCK